MVVGKIRFALTGIDCGLFGAVLLTVSVPASVVTVVGLTTSKTSVQVPFGARMVRLGHVEDESKANGGVGLTDSLVNAMADVPVFLTVTVWRGLVVPSITFPKLTALTESVVCADASRTAIETIIAVSNSKVTTFSFRTTLKLLLNISCSFGQPCTLVLYRTTLENGSSAVYLTCPNFDQIGARTLRKRRKPPFENLRKHFWND
jgi:hypothetical protein